MRAPPAGVTGHSTRAWVEATRANEPLNPRRSRMAALALRPASLLGRYGVGRPEDAVEPGADDRDVDPLVAAQVSAVARVPVAGVADDLAVEERRATGVAEARAPASEGVLLVALELEELRRELLGLLIRVLPSDRVALRGGATRTRSS